jgi:hypothetical protein
VNSNVSGVFEEYGDKYVISVLMQHLTKGVGLRTATFYLLLRPGDLDKVHGRREISRVDFRVVAKYLRTIYCVM